MPIDKSQALNDLNLTEEIYDDFLSDFLIQAESKMSSITASLHKNDLKNAADHAHSLKGIAGNMRLDSCFSIARDVELTLKAGETEPISKLLTDLSEAVQEVRGSIKKR